jgi:outer membrane protein TolC
MSASPRTVLALTALALAASVRSASAQPAAAPPQDDFVKELATLVGISGGLTSDDAAGRAVKVSPDVRRRGMELLSAHAQLEQTKAATLPRLDTTIRYTRLSSVTLPAFFTMLPSGSGVKFFVPNNYNMDAQLAVPISDYFIRYPYLIDAAKANETSARIAQKATEVGAALDARVAYYEWARARLDVVVAERLVAQVSQTVDQVAAQVEVQRASKADLLRLQAQKAAADLAVEQAKGGLAIREEQLRILIGAQPEELLQIGEDLRADIATPELASLDELVRDALQHRLETRTLAAAEDALVHTQKAQRADRLPRLSAFAQANYDKPNQRAFGSPDLELTWALGAQITWSPNDLLVANARIDDTEARIMAIGADRERLADNVRAEIDADVQRLVIAKAALVNTREGLTAAEESYRVRKELLDAQRVTAVELVDAQTALTRAQIEAIDARIDLRIALATLRHALGQDVE